MHFTILAFISFAVALAITSVGESFAISSSAVVTTVDLLGDAPSDITYDPINKRMYVTNFGSDTVSVIDTNTNTLVGNPLKVGSGPSSIAYDPINNKMYVTNFRSNSVSIIDTNTNRAGEAIPVRGGPLGIAYDSVNSVMYVSSLDNNTISAIDTGTKTIIGSPIEVGISPKAIAYDPVYNRLYVTNFGAEGAIYQIDTKTNTVLGSPIETGGSPQDIDYDPINKRVYVTNPGSDSVFTINTSSNTSEGRLLYIDSPRGMAYDSMNQRMFVSSADDNIINVIDTKSNTVLNDPILSNTDVSGSISYDPLHQRLYTLDGNTSSVSVVQLLSYNTTITSSTDGLGYSVANGALSSSDEIFFTFNETNISPSLVQGYECGIDGPGFSPCTSPQGYDNLAENSQHIFTVRMVDKFGNRGEPAAQFVWRVGATSHEATNEGNITCESRNSLGNDRIEDTYQDNIGMNPMDGLGGSVKGAQQFSRCFEDKSYPSGSKNHLTEGMIETRDSRKYNDMNSRVVSEDESSSELFSDYTNANCSDKSGMITKADRLTDKEHDNCIRGNIGVDQNVGKKSRQISSQHLGTDVHPSTSNIPLALPY